MNTPRAKCASLVSTFGVLGYLSLCFQWLWAGVVLLPLLMENQMIYDFLVPASSEPGPAKQLPIAEGFSPLLLVASVAITVVVVLVSVVILVRLPIAIAKTGKKTVQTAAESIVPLITHHQPLPPKKKRLLTFRLIKLVKLIACLAPLLLLGLALPFIGGKIPGEVIMFVGALMGIASMVWFGLQYGLAAAFRLPAEKII